MAPIPTQSVETERQKLPRMRSSELWYYFGPAFVASIAYIDPGNFATNFDGGARFGYRLLWVLLWSNAMAILIQYLSAKLGIATGQTLPQNCRNRFSRRSTIGLWIAAEISALATDLAEFLGAALGFYLLFGPWLEGLGWSRTQVLLAAALVSAVCVFAILALELYGFRKLEMAIMGFVCVIGLCYAVEIFFVHPDWKAIAYHTLIPTIDSKSIYIAVGMLGATVMPHVVYLHSALVQPRVQEEKSDTPRRQYLARLRHLRFETIDVFAAMNGAWLVNSAMIVVSAAAFAGRQWQNGMSIEEAHRTLGPLLGPTSATVFAIALLCSGLSSSTVGTMAGQVVLEGFLDVKFSIFLRRLLTLVPAIVVIAMGLDPLKILILSQVCLSFTLPFALIPLLVLTGNPDVMGAFVNNRLIRSVGWFAVSIIVALNGFLLWQTLSGQG
ncbi:Nramp family divalent metal transporter [Pseudacidobacterium ailaaui]|uniref:Nramp family divalent metal transporter n=1 Tax=Pseudacidobacterium ailaaui TaxID=1382359 RepID=UPI0009DDF593|nr:Nramp family divalent metal transporter [Pseudacidobacterium ailaaui]MBX6359626.1 Nramp family divalent metal transporter [Pseudacidobacterium ailaaui]MCL6463078.1 Nramp family divalent metal transporter [Pseudacidobacterium ailaaui]